MKNTGAVAIMPLVKIEKEFNQTCRLMVRGEVQNVFYLTTTMEMFSDLTPLLQIQQLHRWKKLHPEWRMNAATMSKLGITGSNVPDICRPAFFAELIDQENGYVADFLTWEMSEFDTRQGHPDYFIDYVTSGDVNKTLNL